MHSSQRDLGTALTEEPVSFTCEGMRIAGMLHVPERTPAPGIIFCHGFTGTRIEAHRLFVHAARHLCERGFTVLRFDFRGSGESEGLFRDMTISGEIDDLRTAIGWLMKRREALGETIGVNGLSLGGVVAILTAARDLRIKAVSLWSTPADLMALSRALPGTVDKLLRQGYLDLDSGDRIGSGLVTDLRRFNIIEDVSKIAPRPLLIVHGTDDLTVPLWHAERLYEAAREPKERFFVEGADHTYNRWDWQWAVIERTADWFERRLGP
ncbi:TPA: alpha/beta fold hydrolase [Candidatus Bathyarchaeota archaeon]|nr:alpha/beta fold hydrolase [Candidatus Bathyarchaeota archaeon]